MNIYILYLITGALGGFLGGYLGLGGGIIFVPFLFFIFNHYDVNSSNLMQSAICTSLACVVIASCSSTLKHHKNKLINWEIFGKMLPGLVLGSLTGIILITLISSGIIKTYYGLLLIVISFFLMFSDENSSAIKKKLMFVKIFSFFTGTISSMLGIGGGTITTPYFKFHGESIKTSIGTAAACGIPISLFGIFLAFILYSLTNLIEKNIVDYIDFESFILVSFGAIIFSYIGAATTFITNLIILKYIFCSVLIIIGATISFA